MITQKGIRKIFQNYGYKHQALINISDLQNMLNQLNKKQFDEQIFAQLAQQSNPNYLQEKKIIVDKFIQCVLEAQNILQQNIRSQTIKLQKLRQQQEKLRKEGKVNNNNKIIEELEDQVKSYKDDLIVLKNTFISGHQQSSSSLTNKKQQLKQQDTYKVRTSNLSQYEDIQLQKKLRYFLIVAIIMLLLQIIMLIAKYDFVNEVFFIDLISIYVLNLLNGKFIKITIVLGLISIIFDILWLVFNGAKWWQPPEISDLNNRAKSFYKFCIIITALIMIVKIGILIFLFLNKNIDLTKRKYRLKFHQEYYMQFEDGSKNQKINQQFNLGK